MGRGGLEKWIAMRSDSERTVALSGTVRTLPVPDTVI